MSKSTGLKDAEYAQGGASLGRTKDFMKTPDRFRDSQFKAVPKNDDDFGKDAGRTEAPAAKDKSLKAVKPKA